MADIVCPNCEWEGSEDDLVLGKCPNCPELTSACPSCGERVGANDSFCWNCGQGLDKEEIEIGKEGKEGEKEKKYHCELCGAEIPGDEYEDGGGRCINCSMEDDTWGTFPEEW